MSNYNVVGFGALSYWMPARVDYAMSARLPRYIPLSMRATYDALREAGWRFYVTESKLGYCHQDKKVITIPLTVLGQPVEHVAYMLAHEMAHAHTQIDDVAHGVEFLANFLAIAPRNLWHLEPAYTRLQSSNMRASGEPSIVDSSKNRNFRKMLEHGANYSTGTAKILSLSLVPTQKEMLS